MVLLGYTEMIDSDPKIQTTLEETFGFSTLRPGQAEVMGHLLDGKSAAAVFPTGGGKSLCYQLPSLMFSGITLVVSPLIALMKDQIDALTSRGIAAQRLDSTLDAEAYRGVMEQLRRGQLRMLYVAPERFNNERFRASIRTLKISLFAVDEAHCISEWGHNFRPDYLKLAGYAREFQVERILALTATATEQVLNDIRTGFDISSECTVRTGFYRPNLTLKTIPVTDQQRYSTLLENLRDNPPGPAIVYVTLQKTAESIAERLIIDGFPARAYHAGMKNDHRSVVQDWFMSSERSIVVATIAFGMGIDKADIRYVYHFNLPKSLENYAQEIGRAGRDGEKSICGMLVCTDDLNVLENFVYGDTPDSKTLSEWIDGLFTLGDHFDLNLNELSATYDIRLLVLRTLLTYLELDGYLKGGTPFYADYSFKPLMSSEEILSRFHGERREFLSQLFRQAEQKVSWFKIDTSAAAVALKSDRDRVIRALDWLGEQQMLEVKVSGVRHRYRRLKLPDDNGELAGELNARVLKRELSEIARLHQIIELAGLDRCQTAFLAAHFSENIDQPCGHCSWCQNGKKTNLFQRTNHRIDAELSNEVKQMFQDSKAREYLQQPRALARFLCGLSSPRISRAKLSRHPLFARVKHIPFKDVLDWTEQYLN